MILIAGPCVIESYDILRKTADFLSKVLENKNIEFYFKASCIKDNRTAIQNYRGPGLIKGLHMLQKIKKEYGFKITTDFHSASQIESFGKTVDLIQIPAFLCMQTEITEAASKIDRPIHVKKGQFLGPLEAIKMWKKYKEAGCKKVYLTDRGTQLGYNQLFIDPRHIVLWKQHNIPVLIDITHPNKNYPNNTFEYSIALAKMALILNADGIFMEVHPKPTTALCDSATQLDFDVAYKILNLLV